MMALVSPCISFSVGELEHNNYYQKRQPECMLGTFYKIYHVLFKACVGQRVKLPWWCVILLFIPTEPMVHTDTAKLVVTRWLAR